MLLKSILHLSLIFIGSVFGFLTTECDHCPQHMKEIYMIGGMGHGGFACCDDCSVKPHIVSEKLKGVYLTRELTCPSNGWRKCEYRILTINNKIIQSRSGKRYSEVRHIVRGAVEFSCDNPMELIKKGFIHYRCRCRE